MIAAMETTHKIIRAIVRPLIFFALVFSAAVILKFASYFICFRFRFKTFWFQK
jgi:hypothetical protein